MDFANILNFLCAIAFFLYGINLMSESVQLAFGENFKNLMSKLTSSKPRSVLVGVIVTSLIQSSCAVSVLTQSFVDLNFLTLTKAAYIIMGANIGTTATSFLTAMSFSNLAPFCIIIGASMKIFCKKEKFKLNGLCILGFGLLFLGISTMASSMISFEESSAFSLLLSLSKNRLYAIVFGFIMTSLMQSSSATIGITQVLLCANMIDLESAIFLLFGQNIGAVMPSVISSLSMRDGARVMAKFNLSFNLIGTFVCMVCFEAFHLSTMLKAVPNAAMRVSIAHFIFNVVTTIVIFPFVDKLILFCKRKKIAVFV